MTVEDRAAKTLAVCDAFAAEHGFDAWLSECDDGSRIVEVAHEHGRAVFGVEPDASEDGWAVVIREVASASGLISETTCEAVLARFALGIAHRCDEIERCARQ